MASRASPFHSNPSQFNPIHVQIPIAIQFESNAGHSTHCELPIFTLCWLPTRRLISCPQCLPLHTAPRRMPHAPTIARLEKPLISFHSQWADRGLAFSFYSASSLSSSCSFFSLSFSFSFIYYSFFSFTADSKPAVFLLIFTCRRRLTQFSALHIIILSAVDARWAVGAAGRSHDCH